MDETRDILELAGPLNCNTPNVKRYPDKKNPDSSSNLNAGQCSNNKDRRDSEKTAEKNNEKSPCVTDADFTSPPSTNVSISSIYVSISSVSSSGTGKVSNKTVSNLQKFMFKESPKTKETVKSQDGSRLLDPTQLLPF